jgi:hypothetical protein
MGGYTIAGVLLRRLLTTKGIKHTKRYTKDNLVSHGGQ